MRIGSTILALLGLAGWAQAAAPATQPAPYARISVDLRPHNGRPTVFINDRPTALPAYSPMGFSKPHFTKSVPRFQKHGMGAYFISPVTVQGDLFGTQFWVGDQVSREPLAKADPGGFASIDEQAERVLNGDPGAGLIVRFSLYEPATWRTLHPDEYFLTDEGKRAEAPSLASDVYWGAAARFSAALIQYCESRPWFARIIGYANFHRTEGTHEPAGAGWLFDHSPAMTAQWRAFLKGKYGAIEDLRPAYGDEKLAFETMEVPRDKLRAPASDASQALHWQGARDNQPLRDYLTLNSRLFRQRTRQVQEAMHEALQERRLILFDALKQTMQGWNLQAFFRETVHWASSFIDLNAGSGAMGVAELFDMPGFDGLITPHDYQARGVGGVFAPEGIADSTILRGKYFLCEMDTRTYPDRYNGYGKARDDREVADRAEYHDRQ